jgi:hypothetical protein
MPPLVLPYFVGEQPGTRPPRHAPTLSLERAGPDIAQLLGCSSDAESSPEHQGGDLSLRHSVVRK